MWKRSTGSNNTVQFYDQIPRKAKMVCPFRLKRTVFASFSQQAYPAFALEKRT
jgi:hypothetical protein